jgi:hypothetical protein
MREAASVSLDGPPGRVERVRPGAPVIGLTPDEFTAWARGKLRRRGGVRLPPPWQPGQHVALIGKTREGKTNFAVWLLSELRSYVLALDPKGEDESLSKSGWTRVQSVPGGRVKPRAGTREWRLWRDLDKARAEGRPVRIIVGMQSRTREADQLNKVLMRDAIEYARQSGGWSLYVDEHQILSDRRMYGLGEDIARQAISAARDKMSVIASMQYMAWVEKAATRQATLIVVWRTRDRDLIKLAAQTAGRPWQEVAAAVDELPKYWLLLIPDELRAPMLMVRPPKVT